jgi:hypothetical protein
MRGEADVVVEVAVDKNAVRLDLTAQNSFDYCRVGSFNADSTREVGRESHIDSGHRDSAATGWWRMTPRAPGADY